MSDTVGIEPLSMSSFATRLCDGDAFDFQELEIFDEVPLYCQLSDWTEFGKPKRLWASPAWLSLTRESQEEFLAFDFAGNSSDHMKKKCVDLANEVQIERRPQGFEWVITPTNRKPLRMLHTMYPVKLRSKTEEKVYLAICFYNADNSSMDQATCDVPLDFSIETRTCEKTYKFPDSLRVIDDFPVFTVVFDLQKPETPRKLWANMAWLNLVGQTLEEFQTNDPSGNSLALTHEVMKKLGQQVQLERKVVSHQHTIWLKNQPVRVMGVFRPVLFEGMDTPLAVCTYLPPPTEGPEGGCSARQQSSLEYNEQVWQIVELRAILFDCSDERRGRALWANATARTEYEMGWHGVGAQQRQEGLKTKSGGHVDFGLILSSFAWDDDDEVATVTDTLSKMRLNSAPVTFTRRKREGSMWHQLTFSPCHNPYTGKASLLLQEIDVTNLMNIQQELEASNELKDRFLQCVSHELRTPLHGILNLSGSLAANPECPPRLRKTLITIEQSATHLNGIVNDILETAACMSGNVVLNTTTFSLAQLCDRVCDEKRAQLRPAVTLNNEVSSECAVVADAYKLDRVFSHLIDNAIKFTTSGTISVSSTVEDAFVRVDVTDTGCGIPDHMVDLIWEHFQQGDMSAEREHGGTGLGLTLVKSLVRAHGGDVSVTSEQATGSTFSFTVPTLNGGKGQTPGGSGASMHRSRGRGGNGETKRDKEWERRWSAEEKLQDKRRAAKRLSTHTEDAEHALDRMRLEEAEASLREERQTVEGLRARVAELEAAALLSAGQPESQAGVSSESEQEATIRELQETVERLQAEVLAAGRLEAEQGRRLEAQEQQIAELERELEAPPGWHEDAIASVSHELRTPLNGIIGLSESLIQNPACNELMVKTLKLIKTSGLRLSGLVNDILDKAASKHGTFAIRSEPVALRQVSEQVCEVLAPLCPPAVTIRNEVDAQLPLIEGDGARINQILTNLLSNAIKFTKRGSVTLSSQLQGNAQVLVEVADTGVGISEGKIEQIWSRFDRGDSKTARASAGTGLGLSLVKELVEAHHGTVGVRSNVEEGQSGTTFWFLLPVKQPPSRTSSSRGSTPRGGGLRSPKLAPPAMVAQGVSSASGESASHQSEVPNLDDAEGNDDAEGGKVMHHSELYDTFEILSVDDNMVNHSVVENSLEPRGYQVTKCMGGVEALSLLESRGFLPDLILLDCMMPGMSGYEMCERLRAKYPCNTLPVIMVSAKDKEDDVVKGLKAGCNDYLSKPFGASELNARIEVQLNLKYLWSVEIHRLLGDRAAVLHLPEQLQEQLRTGGGAVAVHKRATVLVCELEDILVYVQTLPAQELAGVVNALYDRFDDIAGEHGVTRIVDDAYMLVLEDELVSESEQVGKMLSVAEALLAAAQEVRVTLSGEQQAPRVRIGIANGEVCSGMVGITLPSYSFFGPGVREAAGLAMQGFAGCALVGVETFKTLAEAERERVAVYTYHQRRRRGDAAVPASYIAKSGRYVEALGTISRRGDDDDEPCSEPEHKPITSAQTHLRAFLRLSAGSSFRQQASDDGTPIVPFASVHDGGPLDSFERARSVSNAGHGCSSCEEWSDKCTVLEEEWAEKYAELQERLQETTQKLKKANAESLVSQLSDTAGSSKAYSLPDVPKRDVTEITVLSVDDDPVNQMVVENLLEPLGYKIVACMTGIEALEYLQSCPRPPDLVLLDMMMPHMNGIECCEKLRETYNRTTLPVIMVSAKTAVESVVEGLEAGCNDYVSKPFNRIELLARISTQLRVREAGRNEVENAKSTKLLQRLLPPHVVTRLKNGSSMVVEEHKAVSILAVGIVGYTSLCTSLPTTELIKILNDLSSTIDQLCERHGCSKVDGGSGDSVMVVAGHDGASADHAGCTLRLALDLLRAAKSMRFPQNEAKHVQLRIGVHSGQAFAGVVGSQVPRYSFFGDAVVTAFGLEATGYAMTVQVSNETAALLDERWQLEPLGVRHIKGKGPVQGLVLRDDACAWQAALSKMQHEPPADRVDSLHSAHASFNIPIGATLAVGVQHEEEVARLRLKVERLRAEAAVGGEATELRESMARMEADAVRNSRLHAQTLANAEWELRETRAALEAAHAEAEEVRQSAEQEKSMANQQDAARIASMQHELEEAKAGRERAERAAREAEAAREEAQSKRAAAGGQAEAERKEVERMREAAAMEAEVVESARKHAVRLAEAERELDDAREGKTQAERAAREAVAALRERANAVQSEVTVSDVREVEQLKEAMERLEADAARSASRHLQALASAEEELEEAKAARDRAERRARKAEEERERAEEEMRIMSDSAVGDEARREVEKLRGELSRVEEEASRGARRHAHAMSRMEGELQGAHAAKEKAEKRARKAAEELERAGEEIQELAGKSGAGLDARREMERLRDQMSDVEEDAARSARRHAQVIARMEEELEAANLASERAERRALKAEEALEGKNVGSGAEARRVELQEAVTGQEAAEKEVRVLTREVERQAKALARVEAQLAAAGRGRGKAEEGQEEGEGRGMMGGRDRGIQRRGLRDQEGREKSGNLDDDDDREEEERPEQPGAWRERHVQRPVDPALAAEREGRDRPDSTDWMQGRGGRGKRGSGRGSEGRWLREMEELDGAESAGFGQSEQQAGAEGRLAETEMALHSLRLDNRYLAATCAALADQVRAAVGTVPQRSTRGEEVVAVDEGRARRMRDAERGEESWGDVSRESWYGREEEEEERGRMRWAGGRQLQESDANMGISLVLQSLERSHREVLDRLLPGGGGAGVRQPMRQTPLISRHPRPAQTTSQFSPQAPTRPPPSAPSPFSRWPGRGSFDWDAQRTPHMPTTRTDPVR